MPADAPLNYGQLYSWREIETYPQEWLHEANLSTTWGLRGIPMDRVSTALQRLVRRHEPLRSTYHLHAGRPVQRVHPMTSPPIEHVDRVITDYGDPDRTSDELAGVPIPMTGSPGWRGQLVSTGGAPMFLSVSFSHLIVDVWSVQKLTAQFHALLADPDASAPAGPTPRQLAVQQRGESRRGQRDGADRYWRRILADGPAWQLPSLPAGAKRHRIQATLSSRRLGGLAAQAARRHKVSTPAVLMALVAAGLARHTDAGQITMSLMSSNRFAPEHQHVVGTMNQLIPVVATVDHGSSVAEHVKRLHWAAARAYRYSCYDYDRVAALAAGAATQAGPAPGHGCWFNHLFRCWFNYLQLDDHPSDPADQSPAELVWTPLARQYGQPVDVRVSVQGGCTSVALRVDPTVIPAEALTDILRAVALGAQRAATDPQSSLKDLWAGPDTDLARSLFPPEIPEPPRQPAP